VPAQCHTLKSERISMLSQLHLLAVHRDIWSCCVFVTCRSPLYPFY
jgi:hypothetical protein